MPTPKASHSLFRRSFDLETFKRDALAIHAFERTCSYRDFAKASSLCAKLLKAAGAEDVERIALKADGKTAYMDYIMPEAWDIEDARLELLGKDVQASNATLADFKETPLCVGNRSAPTPAGGVEGEVVRWEDFASDPAGLKGRMVFTTGYPASIYSAVANAGGLGIISAHSPVASECPKDTYWLNGMASPGWYHTKEDRKIFCFSITPERGAMLAKRLGKGCVKARAFVKSRIYGGKIHTVTGRLPGRSEEEICLFAHIYEPFIGDDSAGAAALIGICRAVAGLLRARKLAPLRKSLRFVISMERYGLAQHFMKPRKMLCGMNMDSICHSTKQAGLPVELRLAPASMPFFGDLMLKDMLRVFEPGLEYVERKGNLSDDTFGSDRKIGVPTNWLWTVPGKYHHNSTPVYSDPDWATGFKIVSLAGAYAMFLAAAEKDAFIKLGRRLGPLAEAEFETERLNTLALFEKGALSPRKAIERNGFFAGLQTERLLSLNRFAKGAVDAKAVAAKFKRLAGKACAGFDGSPSFGGDLSKMERKAANTVLERVGRDMPFSLAKAPYGDRRPHEGCGYLHPIMNWIDGRRSLLEILHLVEFEHGRRYDGDEIGRLLEYFKYLGRYGYVKLRPEHVVSKEDIKRGLRKLGVGRGDRVVLHSSLSSMGEVAGGPETVCKAFMELLGGGGLLMMPSFNHYQAAGSDGKGVYDPLKTPTVNGAVQDLFWRMEGVFRSLDPSHAFAAWGADAASYVEGHHEVPTMGRGSPLELLERAGGKVVLIDCPDANTFIHVVEMTNDAPCLGKRTEEYNVRLPGGGTVKLRTWGWRDGQCRTFEAQRHFHLMRDAGLLKECEIGGAHALSFSMRDFRKVYERLLKGRVSGVEGCRNCPVKPRKVANTVPSDWPS